MTKIRFQTPEKMKVSLVSHMLVCYVRQHQTVSIFTYPEENEFMNNHVLSMPCFKCTRGFSQRGFGILENAYGPASGGLVWYLNEFGGPMSVRIVEYSVFLLFISFKVGLFGFCPVN